MRRVNVAAFPSGFEAGLADALRDAGQVVLSLVAEKDGKVTGSAVFSSMTVEGPAAGLRVAALGPLAVLPAEQGQGIGSALLGEGIERLRATGFDAIALLGSPGYYSRSGFLPASRLNLGPADASIPVSHFQALLLRGEIPNRPLLLRYAPQFFSPQS